MFSFTGLNGNQCAWLIKERSIYLMANGRINVSLVHRLCTMIMVHDAQFMPKIDHNITLNLDVWSYNWKH